MTAIDPADVAAHVDALAGDSTESLDPKRCDLCEWALAHADEFAEPLAVLAKRRGWPEWARRLSAGRQPVGALRRA